MESNVVAILQKIVEEICDDYCKYPDQYLNSDELIESEDSPCNNCPLNRLT